MGKTAALWGYSSAGRAPALQAGCQGFEPPYLHHKISRGRAAASFVLYPVPVLMDARELEAVYRKVMA